MFSGSGEGARFPYREAIASLIYLITDTKPDIAYAVRKMAQLCEHLAQVHWVALKHLIKYFTGAKQHGTLYDGQNRLTLEGYCCADWSGNARSRASTSGFFVQAGSWSGELVLEETDRRYPVHMRGKVCFDVFRLPKGYLAGTVLVPFETHAPQHSSDDIHW